MATTMNQGRTCPKCGNPTATGELADLCPACLLAQGLETEPGTGPRLRFEAPPLDRITRLFPQLEVLGLIGSGGMGAVYKARQPALDRVVALKVLPASSQPGNRFEERFNREARALARLNHPHIVTVHEFGQVEDLHFFLMEFVDGTNLRQLEKTGRLSPREALQIIPQLCDALQYAHDEGVVHRDIKPENVLVDRKGRVKIADFGLAKILDPSADAEAARLTVEGQVMGTPHYMAPEQLEKPLAVDHRADIYSLGVVFYEMLTGDLPLGNFAPPSRKVQVDVRLDEVVLRALENDPTRRYQQASEVKTRLESIAETPAPNSSATAETPATEHHYFAGFPLRTEVGGTRKLHLPGFAKAFAMVFGILTVAFGLRSLFRGGGEGTWFGIIGWPSLLLRLALSAAAVGWAVRASKRMASSPPPHGPDSTLILKPERYSRLAVMGAVSLTIGIVALALFYSPVAHSHDSAQSAIATRVQEFFVVLILITTLLSPLGATVLGWLAVREIRRSNGRVGGLRLALFNGLLLPLFAINTVLVYVVRNIPLTLLHRGSHWSFNYTAIMALGIGFGVALNWLILRRVWSRFRLDAPPRRAPWWCENPAFALLAFACAMLMQIAYQLEETTRKAFNAAFMESPDQWAQRSGVEGSWIAQLPTGGTLELLALNRDDRSETGWRDPDGNLLNGTQYQIVTPGSAGSNDSSAAYDLIFRFTDLPSNSGSMTFPTLLTQPEGNSSSGEGVLKNGTRLTNAWPYRFVFPKSASSATLRLEVSMDRWHTIAIADASGQQIHDPTRTESNQPAALFSSAQILSVAEFRGGARATVLQLGGYSRMQFSVVAIDKQAKEHSGKGDGVGYGGAPTSTTWTYTFPIPLSEVAEFQARVRKPYTVEFQNVVLPKATGGTAARASKPLGDPEELQFSELLDLDTLKTGTLPPAPTGQAGNPIAGIGSTIEYMQANGFDVMHSHDHLDALGLKLVPMNSQDWNSMTPRELQGRLDQYGQWNTSIKPGAFPGIYGFQTRDGGRGLMLIESLTAEATRMRLKRAPR